MEIFKSNRKELVFRHFLSYAEVSTEKSMKENAKIILGIDPGTSATGFGIVHIDRTRRMKPVDYGVIRPPLSKPITYRYRIIFEGITALVKKWDFEAVAVETQYVKKNPQSAIKLGMARAAAILPALLLDIPVFEYPPARAKRAVVGGNASKEQVQKMVQTLLGLNKLPSPHDAADALALAICHAHSIT
ncbi:MAG: crossover junction endodeoxyribonuclease RuvC [Chlamydiales bacterium]